MLLPLVTDPGSSESEDKKLRCLTYNILILLQKAEWPSADYSNLLMEERFASKFAFHTGGGMWWTQGSLE